MESSQDAIIGKALDGTVLSWNAAAERIFGYEAGEMVGQSIRRLIPADRQAEEDRILASVSGGELVPAFETVRLRKDGGEVQLSVTVSPVRDDGGRIVAASKIARDITEQKAVQTRLIESESRFHLLADNIVQLAWIADAAGAYIWYNKRWLDYTGAAMAQMEGWGWKAVHHPDHVEAVTERWLAHLASGEEWEDTFPLRGADGGYRWFLSRAMPMKDETGRIACWFGTNTDITEMRDAEQRIELLLAEVNHRSKNMLAMVQSLARRTVAQGGDYVNRLEQRIQALAINQDLLVDRYWSSVPLRDLVDAQLRFLEDADRRRVLVEGPDIALVPGAAEAIGMAVHEMASNALSHGALSGAVGIVAIRWDVPGKGDGARFRMTWREQDGPAVAEPAVRGLGMRIIRDVPRSKLDAAVELDFAGSGFAWFLDCPAGRVTGAAA
ncbi:MAG: PAS domain S-box protein [Novosphingobium sp.]|nr:PAS domain S-box protein [Novosphingobium sp.]